MRFTKIVCTLGPASNTKEKIAALADAGMNIARLNMSHGDHETHGASIRAVKEINAERAANKDYRAPIGIMMDSKGGEVRTSDVAEPIQIKKGEEIVFSVSPLTGESRKVVIVKHDLFASDAKKAEFIILDNGELTFDIVSIDAKKGSGIVVAKARDDGKIGSRRHVNLPGADLSIPSVTDKDWEDFAFGLEQEVDFLGLSFIREAWEVEEVRKFAEKHKSRVQIITKVETRQAVENIEAIIAASDGIMVARGDLGAEVPFERVPVIQDQLVALCRAAGKPVIVATQMLESMINYPMPTRAEVTDIAHAATSMTDATMLSGETANGKHPIGCINAMSRVLVETEKHLATLPHEPMKPKDEDEARTEAAVSLTLDGRADALVVMTRSGSTVRAISKFRPRVPVIAVCDIEQVARQLGLSYGVSAFHLPFSDDPEATVSAALQRIKKLGLLKAKTKIVLVSDILIDKAKINSIQTRTIA